MDTKDEGARYRTEDPYTIDPGDRGRFYYKGFEVSKDVATVLETTLKTALVTIQTQDKDHE